MHAAAHGEKADLSNYAQADEDARDLAGTVPVQREFFFHHAHKRYDNPPAPPAKPPDNPPLPDLIDAKFQRLLLLQRSRQV
jgi:hypothetical protein